MDQWLLPANQTPDAVYQTASGGGAMILEKHGDSLPETSDPLRSSDVSGSMMKDVKATATTEVKTGQRRNNAALTFFPGIAKRGFFRDDYRQSLRLHQPCSAIIQG